MFYTPIIKYIIEIHFKCICLDDSCNYVNKTCLGHNGYNSLLTGARCSCGQWVTPSFQIHKSKIDQCLPPKHLPNLSTANSNS